MQDGKLRFFKDVQNDCGRNGMEIVIGITPDISKWTYFEFYDCV
jgi:hypothetical protein